MGITGISIAPGGMPEARIPEKKWKRATRLRSQAGATSGVRMSDERNRRTIQRRYWRRKSSKPWQREKTPCAGWRWRQNTPHRVPHEGQEYLFCNPRCLESFRKNPDRYLEERKPAGEPSGDAKAEPKGSVPGEEYTCPMHPEVRQEGSGDCPKCGMALEPVAPARLAQGNGPAPCTRRSFGTPRATARSAGWRLSLVRCRRRRGKARSSPTCAGGFG